LISVYGDFPALAVQYKLLTIASFLVLLPVIAQKLVDSADLPIHSSELMSPTPDSIEVSLTASLKVPLGLSVKLDPTALSLYRPETKPFTPYVTVHLPAQTLKGNTTITLKNQRVKIQNMTEFLGFLEAAVNAEDFVLSARGHTTAHLGKLKVKVTLDKGVKLKGKCSPRRNLKCRLTGPGLNRLKGFNIIAAQALTTPEADGTNFKGTVNLPNPSVVGFELVSDNVYHHVDGMLILPLQGDEVLDLVIPNGLVVGQGTIHNATIAPGNNTVDFSGVVDYAALLGNIEGILNSEADALGRGNLALNANGNSTVYNGVHIPYYEKILNNMTLGTEVPVTQLLVGSVGGLLSSNAGTLGDLVNIIETSGITSLLGLLKK
jgi:hypothetical protein